MVGAFESGALFRVRIQEQFDKVRQMTAAHKPQIVVAKDGEFLIGDNPAPPVRRDGQRMMFGVALGDAHGISMPLGPPGPFQSPGGWVYVLVTAW
jgi:hypothetical protein